MAPEAEIKLWNELMQAQQDYARSLATLDSLFLDNPRANPWAVEQRLLAEAAETRRAAYVRYRKAMDRLSAAPS